MGSLVGVILGGEGKLFEWLLVDGARESPILVTWDATPALRYAVRYRARVHGKYNAIKFNGEDSDDESLESYKCGEIKGDGEGSGWRSF